MLTKKEFNDFIQLIYNQVRDGWEEQEEQEGRRALKEKDEKHLEKLQARIDELNNQIKLNLNLDNFTRSVKGYLTLEEQKTLIEDNIVNALHAINPNLFIPTSEYNALCEKLEELRGLIGDFNADNISSDERSALIKFRNSLLAHLNKRDDTLDIKLKNIESLQQNIESELADESNAKKLMRSVLLSVSAMLAAAAIGAAIGFVAGLPTGPGAILTGIIGAISGATMATSTIAAGSAIIGTGIAVGITSRFTLFRNKPESFAKQQRDATLEQAKSAIQVELTDLRM